MARTAQMRLVELMVLKQDIENVILYLGKCGSFQFQNPAASENSGKSLNKARDSFNQLEQVRTFLGISDDDTSLDEVVMPVEEDYETVRKILAASAELSRKDAEEREAYKKIEDAYKEAASFANLKASYSELEHLSFLSFKIGKIDPSVYDSLKFALGARAIIVPLGEDKSRILAASSKKGRFALETELKNFGFVNMEIPKDFKGIPDDILETLKKQKEESEVRLNEIIVERNNFTETHAARILELLKKMSIGAQVYDAVDGLESTQLVYRIRGWVPYTDTMELMKSLDQLTQGRISIRQYKPEEVPGVISGQEKVPVHLTHGKFVNAFNRMIFSYGSPLYGTIDPTPYVAVFFTILFGIMFGDAGQGLVFLIAGVLMALNVIKVGGWNKFAPIFIAIGITSTVMGLLTGEFFANETVLQPFAMWVTGLFGEPRHQILHMMPQSDPESIKRMFMFFGFSIGVGFIINSVGLVLNIINNFVRRRVGHAIFGKTGLSGALFFWYIVVMVIRIAAFGHAIAVYDWIVIGITLFLSAFGEPFIRLVEGHRPVLENGIGTAVIEAVVEILEIISSYLSNSISFLRVGAFALSHAVLGFIINTMMELVGGVGAVAVGILGNALVIVLEGMIVAIQVIRLQYYEFFSKFFNETGREFNPFAFEYKAVAGN